MEALTVLANSEGKIRSDVSEEAVLAALRAVTDMLAAHTTDDTDADADADTVLRCETDCKHVVHSSVSFLGNVVWVLLEWVWQSNKLTVSRTVSVAALQAVSALLTAVPPKHAVCVFPGVLLRLSVVATAHHLSVGSRVVSAALSALSTLIHTTLSDTVLQTFDVVPTSDMSPVESLLSLARSPPVHTAPSSTTPPAHPTAPPPPPSSSASSSASASASASSSPPSFTVPFDREWVATAARRLHPHISRVLEHCAAQDHHRTRLAVVGLARTLACDCRTALPAMTVLAVEAVLGLADDDRPEVCVPARAALEAVVVSGSHSHWELVKAFKPRFWASVTALPRAVRSSDRLTSVLHLRRVKGYCSLLRSELRSMLATRSALRRLAMALVQCVELHTTSDPAVSQPVVADAAEQFQPPFKFLTDSSAVRGMKAVVGALAAAGDVLELSRLFATLAVDGRGGGLTGRHGPEAVLVLDLLIQTADPIDPDVVDLVLPVLVSLLSSDQASSSNSSPQSVTKTTCVLSAIGSTATAMGAGFRRRVVHVLFPVVQAFVEPNRSVSHAAGATLSQIAVAVGCASRTELLVEHVDYLVDALCSQLDAGGGGGGGGGGGTRLGSTAAVAECVARHAILSASPVLRDFAGAVFRRMDTVFHSADVVALLRVLHALAVALRESVGKAEEEGKGEEREKDSDDDSEQGDDDDDEQDDSHHTPSPGDPLAVVERLVATARHYLGSSDLFVAQQAFAVVYHGCVALQPRPRRLFPLLHTVWPSLLPRLTGGSAVPRPLRQSAVWFVSELVGALGCGDFLRRRLMDGVWPAFRSTLSRAAATFSRTSSAPVSSADPHSSRSSALTSLTGDDRIVASLCRCVARLLSDAVDAAVFRNRVWEVACAVLPFVSAGAHPIVYESAMGALRALSGPLGDADSVWLLCQRTRLPSDMALDPPPASPLFPPLRVHTYDSLSWAGHPSIPTASVAAAMAVLRREI